MKLRSFHIQNYKCLKNVQLDHCSDFHALVGANSAGKSSVFETLKLIKNLLQNINSKEIVYGGVKELETKIIQVNLQIEIPDDLREIYLHHFLNIVAEDAKKLLDTDALKLINLQLEVKVAGTKSTNRQFDHLITLTSLDVAMEENNFFSFIKRQDEEIIHGVTSVGNEKKLALSSMNLRENFQSIGVTQLNLNNNHYLTTNQFIGRFIEDLKQSLRDIQPIRESSKEVNYQFVSEEPQVGDRGQNLANFMDTMYTNNRERYYQVEKFCKTIFPNIESITPQKLPGEKIRIVVAKKNLPYLISMGQEGRGLDQLLIVIWKIATSPKGTIWLLDEPEIHLHPGAEKLLYDFLIDETKRNKQIIVATHSMVFIHKTKVNDISILLNKDGSTELASLNNLISAEGKDQSLTNDEIRKQVYQALGYDSTFAFEPTTVVVVEGKTDEKIFHIFSKILGKPINLRATKFIPVGDKRQAEQFSPVLTYAASSKKVLIILDNDKEKPDEIKKKILQREDNYRKKIGVSYHLLNDENFGVYREEAYSIEFYLLDPKAIARVVNAPEKIEQIRNQIKTELAKPLDQQIKPKDFLQQIWSDNGFGPYNEVETSLKIAENTSKDYLLQFPEIVQIIEKINE